MNKTSTKKPTVSTRDRHLKWINFYGSKNFGIYVECTECRKWRKTFEYCESHEVPKNWCCSMLTLKNGKKQSCTDPEKQNAEQYLDYSPGSIVWAKLEGYPWWPCMVDGDPETDEYYWCRENGSICYNVTFLDEKPTHAWIPQISICPFLENPEGKKKLRENRYAKAISMAKKRAEAAMQMTIEDRLQRFSFVHSYKGRWPSSSVFENCDTAET